MVQADPPDTALASHWLKLLQTNALSLTSRKLIGTGKSLGQLINIIAYEKEKIFLQVNIGDENQKSGINKSEIKQLATFCKEINLDLIGLMCIPPANIDPENYFLEMKKLNKDLCLSELSMGMSSDFLKAAKHSSTYIRVGSKIFGQRS